jgi:hypothetical protein
VEPRRGTVHEIRDALNADSDKQPRAYNTVLTVSLD